MVDADENGWPVSFVFREDKFYCRRPDCNPLYGHTAKGAKEHWVALHSFQQPFADQFEASLILDHLGPIFGRAFMEAQGYVCPVCQKFKTVLDSKWSYIKHLKIEHDLESLEVAPNPFAGVTTVDEPIPDAFWNSCMKPVDSSGNELSDRWMCLSQECNPFYPMSRNELQSHFNSDHTRSALANIKRYATLIGDYNQFYMEKGNHRYQCCFRACNNDSLTTCFESFADSARHLQQHHPIVFAHISNANKDELRKIKQDWKETVTHLSGIND